MIRLTNIAELFIENIIPGDVDRRSTESLHYEYGEDADGAVPPLHVDSGSTTPLIRVQLLDIAPPDRWNTASRESIDGRGGLTLMAPPLVPQPNAKHIFVLFEVRCPRFLK